MGAGESAGRDPVRRAGVRTKLQAVSALQTAAKRPAEAAPSAVDQGGSQAGAKVKSGAKSPSIHKGCFDYVKNMGPTTPEMVQSVVCCTVTLASGQKVTDFKAAQAFCKNKNAALKAVQAFDVASAEPKLLSEARRLYSKAHEDMAELEKKSKVVAEMGRWNRSMLNAEKDSGG